MYRSTYEAYNTPRYLKPWNEVCKAASEQYEADMWKGPGPSNLTATQIVKQIRKGLHR